MRHALPAWSALGIAALSALAACAKKDPLYCDGNTPCADDERPFCDDDGAYPASDGIKHTCIPYPWDAGSNADAGPACTPGEWTVDTIAAGGNVGSYSTVVAEADGTVHVGFYSDERKLLLARGRAGNWIIEDPGEPGGFYVQMRLDRNGTIHVAHGVWPAGLRYLRREVGESEFSVEGVSGGDSYDVMMAVDEEGVPVICYTDASSLSCVRRNSPSWDLLPAVSGTAGAPVGLAVDSSGMIHLAMWGAGALYAQGDGLNPWSDIEMVANGVPTGLVVDASSTPHVLTGQGTEPRHYTRNGVDDWSNGVIDSTASVHVGGVFALGSDGSFHAAYADEESASFKYAYRASREDPWEPETIDTDTTLGSTGSIFVDDERGVHVTYYDQGNQNLRYAYRCPSQL